MYTNYETNCCEESIPFTSCNNQLPTYCCPPLTCCPCPTTCTTGRRYPKLEPSNKVFTYNMSARNKAVSDKNESKSKKKSKGDSLNNSSNNASNNASNNSSNNASNNSSNNSSNNASKNSLKGGSKNSSKNNNRTDNSNDLTDMCKNTGGSNSLSSLRCSSAEGGKAEVHSFICQCKCTCDLTDSYCGKKNNNNNDYKDLAGSGKSSKSMSQTSLEREIMCIKGGGILSHNSNVYQQQTQQQQDPFNQKNKNLSYSPKKNTNVPNQSGKRADKANILGQQPNRRNDKLNNFGQYSSPNKPLQNKHAFSTTKSCPQLDVIDEEESEEECTCAHQKQSDSSRPLSQKSLEDSCADFLNIVCDNILESVQQSVDTKLKEFNIQAAEKFQVLGRKLERNETAMLCLCTDVLKKITEQNKANFAEFYSLIQDLVGSQAKQGSSDTPDKESKSDKKILADEVNKCKMLSLKKTCEQLASERNCGGGGAGVESNDEENTNLRQTDTILKIWGQTKECPTIESSQESLPLINYSCKEKTRVQKYLPPSFTTFSLTPNGKTSFNCQVDNSDKTKTDDNDNDNYDTSGYATEPEDNIEENVTNNSRKKLQKKASKQYCSNNNSNVSSQELVNVGKKYNNDSSENNPCDNFKKQSRNSSSGSSPTRLSRL